MKKLLTLFFCFPLCGYAQLTDTIRLGASTGQDDEVWYTQYCAWAADKNNDKLDFYTVSAWTWNASGGCGEGGTRIYLQFLADTAKYQNMVLTKAVLKLYAGHITTMPHTVGNSAFWVQQVTSAWDASTMTWNSGQPSVTASNQVSVPAAGSEYQDYSIDVTPIARQWFCKGEPNFGFRIVLQDYNIYRRVTFSSSENLNVSRRPLLELTFVNGDSVDCDSPPPPPSPPPSSSSMFIPNVFSPNSDNYNDSFDISVPSSASDFNLVMYNRWGEQLFFSDKPAIKWDGTYEGRECPEGVYFFILKYADAGKQQNKTGTITLVR